MRGVILFSAPVLWAVVAVPSQAQPTQMEGPGGGSTLAFGVLCPDADLFVHHDGSFENGVAWTYGGVQEPYYGAFGEAFDLGAGDVECVSLWLTQDGFYSGQSTDVYVWEDGIAGEPGSVVGVVTGIVFEGIATWPDVSRHDVEISVSITGPFTVGSWGNWVYARNGY